MPFAHQQSAELAARLAREVGAGGVVCLGCGMAGFQVVERGLITLSRPPLRDVCLEPERLLLVAAPYRSRALDIGCCAAAGVPEVWLFDARSLESLSLAVAGRYRRRSLILPGERVYLAGLPEVKIVPLPAR